MGYAEKGSRVEIVAGDRKGLKAFVDDSRVRTDANLNYATYYHIWGLRTGPEWIHEDLVEEI